ncbi:hypothetical protein NL676_016191 [Syzygium grande]|nr:hypothetical protein NL676_016191 [Syzygium grande]
MELQCEDTCEVAGRYWISKEDLRESSKLIETHQICWRMAELQGLAGKLDCSECRVRDSGSRDFNGAMRLRREGLRQGQLRMLEAWWCRVASSKRAHNNSDEQFGKEKTEPNIEVQISVGLTARTASSEGETARGQRLVVVVGGGHSSSNFFTDCRRLT